MINIKVNTDIIKSLNPCPDRLDNYLRHYKDFKGDLIEFLFFENITYNDKMWITLRLMPRFLIEVFILDCAAMAESYTAAIAAIVAYGHAARDNTVYSAISASIYIGSDNANPPVVNAVAAAAYAVAAAIYAGSDGTDPYSAHAVACSFANAIPYTFASAEVQRQINSIIWLLCNTTKKELKEYDNSNV